MEEAAAKLLMLIRVDCRDLREEAGEDMVLLGDGEDNGELVSEGDEGGEDAGWDVVSGAILVLDLIRETFAR